MKNTILYQQTLKQTLHMTTTLKKHLEILSKDRLSLANLLHEVCQTNPFLEYTPCPDIMHVLEQTIEVKPSLKDELYYQLHTSKIQHSETIAHYIIESLDSHGFFTTPFEQAIKDLHCSNAEFTETLYFIQTFEPFGVAALNSVDSIIIQLKHYHFEKTAHILKTYPKEIEEKDWTAIATQENTSYEDVLQHLSNLRLCTPFPCSNYDTGNSIPSILPEFEICLDEDDFYIEPKEIGNLQLTHEENSKIKDPNLKKYFQEAKFYIDSLNKRNKTLLILANALINHQKGFFLWNDELKNCTLETISSETDLSISTISRTLNDKYYLFQNKTYPIKNLFVSKTKKGSSKDSIQKGIQTLIEMEDKKKPFKDEELVLKLQEIELFASRRTIAKYREQLNIPNSKQRKKLYKL